jgi:hypothetical protein
MDKGMMRLTSPLGLVFKFMVLTVLLTVTTHQTYAQYNAFEDPPQGGAAGSIGATNQEISPNKPEIDGGEVAQGQTAQVIVLLRNNASTPIALERIELAPSSNISARITNNQCGQSPIKPNIECAVTVSVKGESTGKFKLGMLIYHNGKTQLSNAFIIGTVGAGKVGSGNATGLPTNEIEAFPIALDFGQTKGRTPLVRSIALRNASSTTVKITGIDLAASPLTGFSVAAPDCKELLASQACVATVTWAPLSEGKSEGVLVLRHDGPSGSLQIPLSGEYQLTKTPKAELFPSAMPGKGLIVADLEKVDFGGAVDGAASITVTLINNGEKAVSLKQVRLAGSDNGLSLSGDDCAAGQTLEPYQGCALTINWTPRREGPVIDDVQIIHDGARGVLILPVRGKATKIVTGSLPLLSNVTSALPKLDGKSLDESLVGAQESDTPAMATDTASLNGYRVTSLSKDRAILAGPNGRVMVRNNVRQAIGGGYWLPRITPEGVRLSGERDKVLLIFDRTLTVGKGSNTQINTFPAGSTTSTTSSSSSSSTTSGSGTSTP